MVSVIALVHCLFTVFRVFEWWKTQRNYSESNTFTARQMFVDFVYLNSSWVMQLVRIPKSHWYVAILITS